MRVAYLGSDVSVTVTDGSGKEIHEKYLTFLIKHIIP
jgi:hypothetical protein